VFLAALVTIVGVPSTAGAAHPPTVFGYYVMWSTGTVFLFGIMVGAVALLELIMLVAGVRSLTRRRYDARSALARLQREILVVNRRLDTRFKHQRWADSTDVPAFSRGHGNGGAEAHDGVAGRLIHSRLTRRETETANDQPIDTK
jgi:hypothetical protein